MKVDMRIIKKKTGCTDEQAKYLACEIRKLPKLKEQIMNNLNEVNLYGCDKVVVVRHFGYRDDGANIVGYRPTTDLGICVTMYKFCFDILFKDSVFKEVI
jgi:hypothetical protein